MEETIKEIIASTSKSNNPAFGIAYLIVKEMDKDIRRIVIDSFIKKFNETMNVIILLEDISLGYKENFGLYETLPESKLSQEQLSSLKTDREIVLREVKKVKLDSQRRITMHNLLGALAKMRA